MDVKCNYDKLPYHKHKATNINWEWSFDKCNVSMHLKCNPNPNPKTSQRAVGWLASKSELGAGCTLQVSGRSFATSSRFHREQTFASQRMLRTRWGFEYT